MGWAGYGSPAVGGAAAAGGGRAALPPGAVRLLFGGARRLAGCVAWDSASGLLAVELQPDAGEDESGGATRGGMTIPVAILDPQAPESHFVARVPTAAPTEPLAALCWSPPGCRRVLLAVTARGRAYQWTMEASPPPAASSGAAGSGAAAAAAAAGSGGGGGAAAAPPSTLDCVPCVNVWHGRHAFDLPLAPPELRPESSLMLHDALPPAAADPPPSLVCCRFLTPPTPAAAAWDVAAAPPHADSDRRARVADVVELYRQRGLEGAFAPRPPAAAPPQEHPGVLPLHWLRPGLLCLAAVTSSGQLLLACCGHGGPWVLSPAVQLPGAAAPQLRLADVAAAGGGGGGGVLLVAAVAWRAEVAASEPELQLFEVRGVPPALLPPAAAGQPAAQQHVSRVALPQATAGPPAPAIPPGTSVLAMAFLPGQPALGGTRLLVACSRNSMSSVALLTCSSSSGGGAPGGGGGGLHSWQVKFGVGLVLDPGQQRAVAVTAHANGATAAVLLPGTRQPLGLNVGVDTAGRASVWAAPECSSHFDIAAEARAAEAAAAAAAPPCLALSPNGLYAAVGAAGASSLLLVPLLELPRAEEDVEQYMLQLGKRCAYWLLTGIGSGPACWDLRAAAGAVCGRWGHHHLLTVQQLVDAAVLNARPEARAHLVPAWGRLKATLLASAAAAHTAAAADLAAAAVRADAAAREWVDTAADIFEHHVTSKAALAAAASKGGAALDLEMRMALAKVLPARYWAQWAADFSCYLARCLLYWVNPKQRAAAGQRAGELVSGTMSLAERFAAEQNASVDSVPGVRLLSDMQFYRSFGRLITAVQHLSRVLSQTHRRLNAASQFTQLMQQVQQLVDAAKMIKHLNEAFAKARLAASEAGDGAGGGGVEATARGTPAAPAAFSGAWTLTSVPPAPALTRAQVTGALSALRQQQGGTALLSAVTRLWEQQKVEEQAAEAGDTPASLLKAAAALGLLPAERGGGGGGGDAALLELLRQRQVALGAAEAGDWPDGVPLPPPAAALGWSAWGTGDESSGADAAPWGGSEAAWEAERNAALGLPRPAGGGDTPESFKGGIDVLTGRPISWEHRVRYAAADGSCATAEFLPTALLPGSMSVWQAGYVVATPVGRQTWKRLRVA